MNNPSNKEKTIAILQQVRSGAISVETALDRLRFEPFEDLGYAKIDHHRVLRQGIEEVIYGPSKTPEHIAGILSNMRDHDAQNVLVTRISDETAEHLIKNGFEMEYHPIPRLGIAFPSADASRLGNIIVASGGTGDISVCEEAALTAETLGNKVTRIYDVGVAGLHRLLAHMEELVSARVIVVVAGMEGALASVIAGLVSCPVIAVPTSVGYGASLGGLSALLSMLNSCACGVSVVNIDNGFGAGIIASRINQMDGVK